MCLSTVYKGSEAVAENKLAEDVTGVDIKDGQICLRIITGEELTFRGAVRYIDLVSNRIFVHTDN